VIDAFALMGANYLLVRFNFKRRRLDQAPEGRPTTIIEGGRIRQDGLAKELLTESELLTVAAPAKGFSSLEEIENRELAPGGGFFIRGKTPPPPERRRVELPERLDRLDQQPAELRLRT
jgi:hypothetical protein